MEKTEERIAEISPPEKESINWAQYLDCERLFEPAEINNITQEFFKKDCQ